MQTFLPFEQFESVAEILDRRRLNKQRIETYQILRAITDDSYGWQNHPAVNMWRGHDQALLHYGLTMCHEWTDRGGADNTKLEQRMLQEFCTGEDVVYPEWIGDKRIHESHKANLYFKDTAHYGQFWEYEDLIPYYWPV